MSKEIDQSVKTYLESIGVVYTAVYVGQSVQWGEQTVDSYRVSFNKFTTDYHMGLGNRKLNKPVSPTAASVLYSLLMDAQSIETSFEHWCSDLGYDADSISALNIYTACCKVGKELNKVFTPEQRTHLSELLQDY